MAKLISVPGALPTLWAASAKEPPLDLPSLAGEERADVVVIGGGFTGVSTALHLAERGVAVVLLEAEEVGWGASGRNGGQVVPGLKTDPDDLEAELGPERGTRLVKLAGSAADVVFDLVERHAIACAPVRTGWIQGAHSPLALEAIKRRAEQWARRGAPVEVLSRTDAEDRIGTPLYSGGLIDKRGGTVQPLAYVRGLARAARGAGARLFSRSAARSLRRSGGTWKIEAAGGAVTADRVVIGTDGYTGSLWPGLERTILTVQSIQIATEPLSHDVGARILPGGECVSDTRKLVTYFRRDPEGRLLIGGRGPTSDLESEGMFELLRRRLTRMFPKLEAVKLEDRCSGRVALTLDHLPHLHEPAPGLHIGLGYNGRGVAMATVMGRILADRATGESGEDADFPVTRMAPIPWHAIRQPLMAAAIAYYRIKDRIGLAS